MEFPQGLKPGFEVGVIGAAEAAPLQRRKPTEALALNPYYPCPMLQDGTSPVALAEFTNSACDFRQLRCQLVF